MTVRAADVRAAAFLGAVAACAAACGRAPRFAAPMTLGGKSIPADVLNDGHEAYTHYCRACHGDDGKGSGPAAPGMRPPPRDLTTGMYKFGGVAPGELPHDEDLIAIVRNGLDGTPMLPWDMTDRERHAVIQYVKSFAEVWKAGTPGTRIVPDAPDPWTGRAGAAVERGKRLYHLMGAEMDPAGGPPLGVYAGCITCHPSYVPAAELQALSQRILGKPAELRQDPFRSERKDSEYLVDGAIKVSVIPTDFYFQRVKNGRSLEAVQRTIAAGVGGTAMPLWKSSIPDPDLWALAHYVRSLSSLYGTPRAVALRAELLRPATPAPAR